ncbi:MAG: hypothetical protein IPG49_14905 [Proteobacteria bacterium]|nr:hypothetical protein [Pseudomonadota bacterium]
MQATPIVVDGVMYTSGVAGRVYALDAATGERAVALRAAGRLQERAQRLLRHRQSRRVGVEGQGVRGHLRWNPPFARRA